MSIEDIRNKIDGIDEDIVKLIAERVKLAAEIGEIKKQNGLPVEDVRRERGVIDRVRELANAGGLPPDDVEKIYRRIVTAARAAQGITVAFQGEFGAYSEAAAVSFFGGGIGLRPCESLEGVFGAVERDELQFGIAPIENSLEGSISKTYDLLLESDIKVAGETELRISHCLIVNPGVTLNDIKKIYSHPQALGQSQAFIKHLGCELIPAYDTAGSVKMIKERGLGDAAAIASARAAEIYKMKTLACGIEDNPHNYTRFFILAREDAQPTGNDKTSVVFSIKHKPGTLFGFLKVLAEKGINLTKIESRPTRQKPWDYNFYLDFEGHRQDAAPAEALCALEDYATFIKVLGSYPRASKSSRGDKR